MKFILTFVLFTAGIIYQTNAGTIKIRMAEAYNGQKPQVASQLKDVAHLLKKSLAFNSYTLHGTTSVETPVDGKVSINDYEISCKGDDKKLQVTIYYKNKSILKSNVVFRGRQPVIIGGLKGSKGKIFFIFSK